LYKVRPLIILTLTVFALLIIPILALVVGTEAFPEIGRPTFSFFEFFGSAYAQGLIATTLEFSISHAFIGVALAVVYAWIVAKTKIPGRWFFELLPVLGLTMPIEMKSFAWTFLLSPNAGILNKASVALFGPYAPIFNINSMPGLIFVAGVGAVPLAYLIIMPAMKSIETSLEEASHVAGRGTARTALTVTIRLVLPAAASAFLLSVIAGLGNFDYPFIIGGPANIHTLATEVYYWTSERSPPSYGSAGLISIAYFSITMVGVALYIWATRRTFRFAVITGKSGRPTYLKLKSWKKALSLLICIVVVLLEFGLPFGSLLFVSFTTIYTSPNLSFQFTGLQYYIQAVQINGLINSLSSTLTMGIIAAAGCTVIGALLSFTTLKSRARGARLTEFVSSIPLAFPGVVYTVGLFWMFLIVPGFNIIYGTVIPMAISLIFIRLPYSTRIISGNLVQVSNELEEASQVAGSRFMRTFSRISMPLVREGLINSFIYSLIDSLRELGGVILLAVPGVVPFTVFLLDYYESLALTTNVVAAGSVILTSIIVLMLVALTLFSRFLDRGRRRRGR
jgi:iron(III) transport system permease protein